MIELIQNYIFDNYMYLQLIPAIIGLVCFKKIDTLYKCFVLLLWYSIFNEYLAIFYPFIINDNPHNSLWYNVYNAIYFAGLFYLFYNKSNNNSFKRIIKSIVALYFMSICFELFILHVDYNLKTQVIPYLIGGLGVLICVFYYFLDILSSNKVIAVHKDLLFWIAIAHFIYFLGFVPYKFGQNYLSNYEGVFYLNNIKIPVTFLKSIILSIGFLCSQRKIQ